MEEIHRQEKHFCGYQHTADKYNIAKMHRWPTDRYVEPLCRLGGRFVKSALEEVEAGCVRPGVSDSG